ncbi:protein O-GlcNAcase-like isoform X2 [Haliotis asinina]|uniref:protein O-GlcNAcase-like isoform X2 n=1 Tax=Haliotis asinina TaxID=109174 RepID=UPI0035321138
MVKGSSKIGSIASRCQKGGYQRQLRSRMTGKEVDDNSAEDGTFVSGVVEGFYGKPWSTDQRKLLFAWMNKMGLNTYMYAPKDDCKHRAFWRELYSVEEADHLTNLVEAAHQNNVNFVYAISPGLDITFSSTKDITCLKRKLEQVSTFGCKAFAILFDDIDPEISEADRSVFPSSAFAQASVTNEVYEHLGQPKFLFCPTEYCASRAIPNVLNSDYLTTIGSKLLPGINVMWTGPKVISKKLSIQSLEEVASVLKRPPVIWDNIHANDYDPRRIFLGPYDGRSPEIIPYLRGVMTNPNTEFEANFIACHTLAQWCKSNVDGVKKDIISGDRLSPVASDIKLETESDFSSDEDIPTRFDTRYQPRQALKIAVSEWLVEFSARRLPPKRPSPPMMPMSNVVVSTCTALTPTTTTFESEDKNVSLPIPPLNSMDSNMAEVDNVSYMQPSMNPVNSLVDVPISDTEFVADNSELEPMDCVPTGVSAIPSNVHSIPKNESSESLMQIEVTALEKAGERNSTDITNCEEVVETSNGVEFTSSGNLTYENVSLLVDLFYTPFEYGSKGCEMMQDLYWLRANAHVISSANGAKKIKDQVTHWFEVAKRFEDSVGAVLELYDRLVVMPNKSLLMDIFPYLWDLRGVLQTCCAYVKWMGGGRVPYMAVCHLQGSLTWLTKGYKEAFVSGDQEPWVFRGGLQAEFQRMLPIDTAHDLFFMTAPDTFVKKRYVYRPYHPNDKDQVYQVCLKTCDDGMDGTDVFPDNPQLMGDRLLGGLVTNSHEYCFVVEDEEGICGYALCALDSKQLHQKTKVAWIPSMCQKYPKPDKDDLSPADELILSFHNEQQMIPEVLYKRYPSLLRVDVLPNRIEDPAVPKRLLACALCAVKTSGSIGVHCELTVGDKYMMDCYAKLGFVPITGPDCMSDDAIFLGRII